MDKIEDEFEEIKEKWNSIPNVIQIKGIRPMTKRERETAFCLQKLGKPDIMEAFDKIEASEYLMKCPNELRFDNFMNLDTLQKVLEGNYDNVFITKEERNKVHDYQEHKYNWAEIQKAKECGPVITGPEKSNDEFMQSLFAELHG